MNFNKVVVYVLCRIRAWKRNLIALIEVLEIE